ncbi:MAG: thioredoxin family protein [Calditrichaceae bacterium]|nr:thioredoxin family protein [Calditrichaceae bacterium]
MRKISILIIFIVLYNMFCACDKAEAEKSKLTANISSEKGCVPDAGCAGCPDAYGKVVSTPIKSGVESSEQPLITFIELGSVNCIPCKMMQPVMKSVEEKYGEQINVVFYDVWQPDQRHYAQDYGIRVIPTQVFLDCDGNEIFRHEGFFPEAELDAFLQENGLTPKTKS